MWTETAVDETGAGTVGAYTVKGLLDPNPAWRCWQERRISRLQDRSAPAVGHQFGAREMINSGRKAHGAAMQKTVPRG
jgi:hypothetical protein